MPVCGKLFSARPGHPPFSPPHVFFSFPHHYRPLHLAPVVNFDSLTVHLILLFFVCVCVCRRLLAFTHRAFSHLCHFFAHLYLVLDSHLFTFYVNFSPSLLGATTLCILKRDAETAFVKSVQLYRMINEGFRCASSCSALTSTTRKGVKELSSFPPGRGTTPSAVANWEVFQLIYVHFFFLVVQRSILFI